MTNSHARFTVFAIFSIAFSLAMLPEVSDAQAYKESALFAASSYNDGYDFQSPLIQASDGSFYGIAGATNNPDLPATTGSGIFRVTRLGKYTLVHAFPSPAAQATDNGLIQGGDGSIYGLSELGGGVYDLGFIFKVSQSGRYSVLYTFCVTQSTAGCTDGGEPFGQLVQGSDGNLYGTTNYGGVSLDGTVFKITPSGKLTTLYSFCSKGWPSCAEGTRPVAGLVEGADGNFYGTTQYGGVSCPAENQGGIQVGCGTVFKITPSGSLTVLHNFTGGNDGAFPSSALVEGPDGSFYGMTSYGPNETYGGEITSSVFKVSPDAKVTSIYNLSGGESQPFADGLTFGSDANLYGTTFTGGSHLDGPVYNAGSIYQIDGSGGGSDIYDFCPNGGQCADGAFPTSPPIQASDGNFYGATSGGGNQITPLSVSGVIYKLSVAPALLPPVALTLSHQNIQPNEAVTLNWSVANAYSKTMQQCYAFVQGNYEGAGIWTGKQVGKFEAGKKPVYQGSASITPIADGTYTYALTCGGIESGFATLKVTGDPPIASVTPAKLNFGGESVGKTSAAKLLTLKNTGVSQLTIASIRAGGQFRQTNTCGTALEPGDSCEIDVTFTPDWTGERTGTLEIADNSGGVTETTQTVALSGTGEGKNQTISWPAITDTFKVGTKLALKASASSGLAVSFASETLAVCTVSKTEASFLKAGTCTIRATQAGNAIYNAAAPVSRNIVVGN